MSVTESSVTVTIEGVEKRFGAHAALRGASLEAAPGEILALLGPSGSGKTTLLRLVAGLEVAEAGRVLFDGADATRLTLRERRVGFVFQHYALFRHMSVAENIAFGLRAKPRRERPSRAAISARVEELLELVRLPGLGARFPAQLSGGQRQRVALARALAIEPRVLLLDEPFGALDAAVRHEMRGWLRAVQRRTGHTALFVTHDQDEAMGLADRVAVLNEGRVEQVGTPEALAEAPATAFVASFLGEATGVPVRVRGGRVLRGEALADGGGADDPIVPHGVLPTAKDGPATLFLRPRHLALTAPTNGALRGTVTDLRRHGAGRRAEVRVAGLERPLEVELREGEAPEIGALIGLRVDRASLFPVDNTGGTALGRGAREGT